jgi:hypothetical protein
LKSGAALDIRTERAKPFAFLQDKAWLNIIAISRHHFNGDPLAFFREVPDSISPMKRNGVSGLRRTTQRISLFPISLSGSAQRKISVHSSRYAW